MASEAAEKTPVEPTPVWQARCLLRAARVGTLATVSKGQPFASLVTPACMPDGSVLILISRLSDHTRHLAADPHFSLLVSGEAATINPQTAPRLTLTGTAEVVEDKALKARYLAIHPYAALYADFGDFSTWRLKPAGAMLVAGFGRAHRLKVADLAPEPAALSALLAAEADILTHCNLDHPNALAAIAGEPGEWRMVTADVDGFDLANGEKVVRIPWSAPLQTAEDVRRELVRLARLARGM